MYNGAQEASETGQNDESLTVKAALVLLADDATVTEKDEELQEGIAIIDKTMGWFEERTNDDKEEDVVLDMEDAAKARMLGVGLGEQENLQQRIKR